MSHITLAHGNGGRLMRELIDEVFAAPLNNPLLDTGADAVALPLDTANNEIMLTTDGFTVSPLEFPGGDIGSLAVNGTVNDLAVAGATPLYLSLAVIIEEGLALETLRRIVQSIAHAALTTGVQVVCGDTKVVPRGQGSGIYITTTGVGQRPASPARGINNIRDGDTILVSGPVGDHGIAVMLAREQFGLRGDVRSDCRSVVPLAQALLPLPGLRFMRDPTRGGLATVLNEIGLATGFGAVIDESAVPVRESVRSVCEILGYDPLYLACEGQIVAVVAPESATEALRVWRSTDHGHDAAILGRVTSAHRQVIQTTGIGGQRVIEELEDDPLPRIC